MPNGAANADPVMTEAQKLLSEKIAYGVAEKLRDEMKEHTTAYIESAQQTCPAVRGFDAMASDAKMARIALCGNGDVEHSVLVRLDRIERCTRGVRKWAGTVMQLLLAAAVAYLLWKAKGGMAGQ